jgi:hypothetical protein
MLPAVFPLLAADSDVTGFIGTSPVRVYRHGEAPQGVVAPYVTWFVVSGAPENELDGLPRVDGYSVQVDCWSDADAEVEQLAEAVRNAIEPSHHMTAIVANGRDPETMRYRIGMTFDFWTKR